MKHLFQAILLLLALLLPATALAHDFKVDGIYYNINGNEATVTFRGTSYAEYSNEYTGDVTIPETVTYNGTTYDITKIGNYAFYNCSGLTSVNIPNSVTTIGYSAFYNCSGLTSVTIGNSVTTIGDCAFDGCTGLTSVTIPNSVTTIGGGAFGGCTGLTNVTIPNSVTTIGLMAFYECSGLTSVTIGNSVTTIGSEAFHGCSRLTSVTIGNSVTSIGFWAFGDCYGLTSVEIPNSVTTIAGCAFQNCSGLTSVTIGNSVTTIGDCAFANCSGLTSVTIPNSVTTIEGDAFWGCSALETLYFNAVSCNDFGNAMGPFLNCNNISNIFLGDSVKTIPAYFAPGLSKITNIIIPNSVIHIGECAFQGCSGLTSVTIGNSVTTIGDGAFYECSRLTSVTIGNSVTTIGDCAFYNCTGLTSVTIPNSVTHIGGWAFSGCSGLTSVNIPNSVTTIDDGAFESCSGLTSIDIPNSVTTIGSWAFSGCSGLTSIDIPNSVTTIGDYAFRYCSGLTCVIVESGNSNYDSRYNCNAIIETASNTLIAGCKNTTIPNSVTSIGNYAFSACSGLTSINIPNSVITIGDFAFYNCTGLTSITIPNSVTTIGNGAFQGCAELDTLNFNTANCADFSSTASSRPFYHLHISTINIGDSVQRIPAYFAYGFTNLTSVSIPNSVTTIGNYAFSACSRLNEVYSFIADPTTISMGSYVFYRSPNNYTTRTLHVPEGTVSAYQANTKWSQYFGSIVKMVSVIYFVDANVKALCVDNWDTDGDGELSITEAAAVTDFGNVFIDNSTITTFEELQYFTGLTSIGIWAFSGCSGLTSITIPNSVTNIGECAFYNCSGLTHITIPNSVTTIGQTAFYECSGLTSVTIGNSVTTIGDGAFDGCRNLTSVTVESGNPKYDSRNNCNAIIETTTNTLIIGCKATVIPNSVTTIGDYAFVECCGLISITIPNSVTPIGDYAFAGCSGLTSITIPNSVTSIGNNAFKGCNRLTTLFLTGEGEWRAGVLPNTVTNLNIDSGITGVKGMSQSPTDVFSFAVTPPACDDNSFTDYSGTLHVPAASLAAYFTAPYWCNFANIVGDAVKPSGLTFDTDSLELIVQEMTTLAATIAPATATSNTITWASTNPDVATVVNGEVTAMSHGECDIIAICLDHKAVCHITVYSDRISVDQQEVRVLPNHIVTLTPASQAAELPTLVVTSSDPTVAAARVMNGKVQVVGITEGTTTITIGSADGTAKPTTCLVTVYTENGDANMDGFIDVSDVTALISYILGSEGSPLSTANADLNGDGELDVSDVTALISLVLSSH